jgi:hypothetical protein
MTELIWKYYFLSVYKIASQELVRDFKFGRKHMKIVFITKDKEVLPFHSGPQVEKLFNMV